MAKLNPEFKQKWIAALRSGDYKQIKSFLKDKYGYCCLGVACELAKIPLIKCVDDIFYAIDGATRSHGYINQMQSLFGLDMDAGLLLAEMNDNGKSFSDIADYIEGNL